MLKSDLITEIKNHWKQLRGMTYDLLDAISDSDLEKRLPFPQSQTIRYQFDCMVSAQIANIPLITKGIWEGFNFILAKEKNLTINVVKEQMKNADKKLDKALDSVALLKKFKDGSTPLLNYLILVEHESHHQGQLINFIYACNLPIPKSWQKKWALTG